MKHKLVLRFAIIHLAACAFLAPPARAEQQTVTQQLSILDERLSKLRADVDALQFTQQQIQQDIKQIQTLMEDVRRAGPGASANDIQALDTRIKALDAAREKDKQVIIDQLAKELAGMGGAHNTAKTPPAPAANGTEHVVEKGETLTSIAKNCGVSVSDLKKANNLSSDTLKLGQKIIIPK